MGLPGVLSASYVSLYNNLKLKEKAKFYEIISLRLLIFFLGPRFSWSPLLDGSHQAVQSSFHCFNCQVSGPQGSSFKGHSDLTFETVTDGLLHLYRAKQLHCGGLKSIRDVAFSNERELTSVVEHLSGKAATTIIQVNLQI